MQIHHHDYLTRVSNKEKIFTPMLQIALLLEAGGVVEKNNSKFLNKLSNKMNRYKYS